MDSTERESTEPSAGTAAESLEERAAEATFVQASLDNSAVLSRTRGGVSDTTEASPDKPKLVVEGEELAERSERNHRAALEFAWRHRNEDFSEPRRVEAFVLTVADQISDGLLQPGQERWRTWETPYHISPSEVPSQLQEFYEELARRLADPDDDPVATAAWIERRIDGQIHAFADGCGRTAKTLSAMVLVRAGHELPLYRSRKEYYGNINGSDHDWLEHYATYFGPEA